MYNFTTPMPHSVEDINELIKINKEVEKSSITGVYFSLPSNSSDFVGFEQGRFWYNEVTDFNYWKPLIEYSMNNGFEFIYLLNSPKIYNPEFEDPAVHLERLDRLINELKKLGCNKLRVCSPQLAGYLNENYPEIELYLSTSTEFQGIKEYANFFSMFQNIKGYVPSWNLNKNFKFLKNITKRFPNIEIELMMNEGCIPNCPLRTSHNIYVSGTTRCIKNKGIFNDSFFINKCNYILRSGVFWYLCNGNVIYPWELEEYRKIGITKFKLVGRNNPEFRTGEYLENYRKILNGIDDFDYIKDEEIRHFNNYIYRTKIVKFKISEIKSYLPKIEHFKKYGHLCASRCGVECRYCYKCAEKIQKIHEKKMKEMEEQPHYVPACTMAQT